MALDARLLLKKNEGREAFVFVLSLHKMRVEWMIERGSESCMIDIDLDIDI
jgi:hypothetical protein